MTADKQLAVFFPGIGYTCDKPLLYYTQKLCRAAGYEIMTVPYGHFRSGIKGDPEKMKEAFISALSQTEELLKDVSWQEYRDIIFVSKSIGTCVAAAFAAKKELVVRSISYTPLKETFLFADSRGIMFHGLIDPWASDNAEIERLCSEKGIPIYTYEGANHSLETGDIHTDLKNLEDILETTGRFINLKAENRAACCGE